MIGSAYHAVAAAESGALVDISVSRRVGGQRHGHEEQHRYIRSGEASSSRTT
jgi:hypothetical protein